MLDPAQLAGSRRASLAPARCTAIVVTHAREYSSPLCIAPPTPSRLVVWMALPVAVADSDPVSRSWEAMEAQRRLCGQQRALRGRLVQL